MLRKTSPSLIPLFHTLGSVRSVALATTSKSDLPSPPWHSAHSRAYMVLPRAIEALLNGTGDFSFFASSVVRRLPVLLRSGESSLQTAEVADMAPDSAAQNSRYFVMIRRRLTMVVF